MKTPDIIKLIFDPKLLELKPPHYELGNVNKFHLQFLDFKLWYERTLSTWLPHVRVWVEWLDEDGRVEWTVVLCSSTISIEAIMEGSSAAAAFFDAAPAASCNAQEFINQERCKDIKRGLIEVLNWNPPRRRSDDND